MFTLTVHNPTLEDGSQVVLIKATELPNAVVCGIWAATGLSTLVRVGPSRVYASVFAEALGTGVTIPVSLTSSELARGFVYVFDGVAFRRQSLAGNIPFGLRNGRDRGPLTCGLCQELEIAGSSSIAAVSVTSLFPGNTLFFRDRDQIWLGVGKFFASMDVLPGFVLSTSLIDVERPAFAELEGDFVLGPFATIDFSARSSNWVATYQARSNSFQVEPARA